MPKKRIGPPDPDGGVDLLPRNETRYEKPRMWKVILLNDDFTPMEFVVAILETYFHKSHNEAMQIMMEVHKKGKGIAGVYTFEVAETKVLSVMDEARQAQHPLQAAVEPE